MIIGTLPVVIALASNTRNAARDGRSSWQQMLPSLGLIALGIALVNQQELQALLAQGGFDAARYGLGALLAVGAVACWTWYPIRNADWLRKHAGVQEPASAGEALSKTGPSHELRSPRTWATAQGLVTLPLAVLGMLGFGWWNHATGYGFDFPLGPRPLYFVALMLAVGLLASWLGTLCWNEASQRLPTRIVGQLIVFETLAALAYAFTLRAQVPSLLTSLGIGLLIFGVLWALRPKAASTATPA